MIDGPLRVIFYGAKSARGRAKAQPWEIRVGPSFGSASLVSMLSIGPGWSGQDPYEAWSLMTAMVDDYNALHLTDGQVAEAAETLRATYPQWRETQT